MAPGREVEAKAEAEDEHRPFVTTHLRPVLRHASHFGLLFGATALLFSRVKRLRLHSGPTPWLAAARVVSAVHASITSVQAARLIDASTFFSPSRYAASIGTRRNERADERLLHLSSGYFAYDLLYILLVERDPKFVAHHLVSLTMWISALHAQRGSELTNCCLLMGESTTTLLNLWWLAKRAKLEWSARLLSRAFTAGFLTMRVGVLPCYIIPFTREALVGDLETRVGRVRARLWAALVVLTMAGGVVWARSLVEGLLKDLRRARVK